MLQPNGLRRGAGGSSCDVAQRYTPIDFPYLVFFAPHGGHGSVRIPDTSVAVLAGQRTENGRIGPQSCCIHACRYEVADSPTFSSPVCKGGDGIISDTEQSQADSAKIIVVLSRNLTQTRLEFSFASAAA